MARIIVSGTIVRYPLAGMVQWFLGWIVGLSQLGHTVYFVEKSGWPESCFDPTKGTMGDDCTYGLQSVATALNRYRLGQQWCYVDHSGQYHGMSEKEVELAFSSADLFLDLEWGEWRDEAQNAQLRVFVDGEPGWFQIKLANEPPHDPPVYDAYYTVGLNIGTSRSSAPTAGIDWRGTQSPLLIDEFPVSKPPRNGPYVTIMNWTSHKEVEYNGVTYGQKDIEFAKFMELPQLIDSPFTLAVAGSAPRDQLRGYGWVLADPHEVTRTTVTLQRFLHSSRGYFSVAKNVRVATNAGWFSDIAGYSLATGRPAILQESGFSDHLPTGSGLFAVESAQEAAEAVRVIEHDYQKHAASARRIAEEYLDARVVLKKMLDDVGVS